MNEPLIADATRKLAQTAIDVRQQRDDAEQALSQAYYLVTGRSPAWSDTFGHEQALEDIGYVAAALKASARASLVGVQRPEDVARAKQLIDASDATVMIKHPEPGYVVVGLKIATDKCPIASKIGAFNDLIDYVEQLLAIRQPQDESSILQDDLRDMLVALGLPDGARPQSPHEVFRECIEAVRQLRAQPQEGRTLANITDAVWEILSAWRPGMSAEVKHTLGIRIAERLARKSDTAALASPRAEGEWQPIETEPSDNSEIWISDGKSVWLGTAHTDGSLKLPSRSACKFWCPANKPAPPVIAEKQTP